MSITHAPTTRRLATEWAPALIGKPWVSGARGPDSFDCWGLLAWVYQTELGIILPDFPSLDPKNTREVASCVKEELTPGGIWQQIPIPVHLCAVGIASNQFIHHVGLWLNMDGGTVLHCRDKVGVVAQSRVSLRQIGLNRLTYYTYVSGPDQQESI